MIAPRHCILNIKYHANVIGHEWPDHQHALCLTTCSLACQLIPNFMSPPCIVAPCFSATPVSFCMRWRFRKHVSACWARSIGVRVGTLHAHASVYGALLRVLALCFFTSCLSVQTTSILKYMFAHDTQPVLNTCAVTCAAAGGWPLQQSRKCIFFCILYIFVPMFGQMRYFVHRHKIPAFCIFFEA